jgi:hypothetical protein
MSAEKEAPGLGDLLGRAINSALGRPGLNPDLRSGEIIRAVAVHYGCSEHELATELQGSNVLARIARDFWGCHTLAKNGGESVIRNRGSTSSQSRSWFKAAKLLTKLPGLWPRESLTPI